MAIFPQTGLVQVSGRVIDAVDGTAMAGVNVSIPDKFKGTITNMEGYFYLRVTDEDLPFGIRFSMMGYRPESYEITRHNTSGLRIRLYSEDIMGEEVVITTPAVVAEQKVFKEIKTVELMDALAIRETPAHNYFEALAYMKGVDVTTQSMQFLTVNARGFNSTENVRFRQIVDGMDNQAPGLNFPVGNIAGLNDLDVESVEFIPGPSTAIYGNNTLNGILLMTSKDPFQYPGLSLYVKPGVADLRNGYQYPFQFYGKPLIDASLRYAKPLGEKMAIKVNFSYMKGKDWYADDTTNIRPGNIKWEWDPGHDGLNQYGDEIMAFLPVGENRTYIPVARTGYKDKHLVNNDVENLKMNASLHYRLSPGVMAILHGNYGTATTVYTGDNRISLSGFGIFQAKAEVRADRFNLYGYTTWQDAGDAYDTRFLAVNMNRLWKSDEQWLRDYENVYLGKYYKYGVNGFDHRIARAFADNGRIIPGTVEFAKARESIISNPDFKQGALIINGSRLWELAGNYSFEQGKWLPGLLLGGNYRFFDLISDGTIFPDTLGNDISFYEYGAYLELSKKMLREKLDMAASLRYDASENFSPSLTPRFSAMYTIKESHSIRFSLLTGTRYPGAKEQFINKDLGPSRYMGGLPGIVENYRLPGNAFYQDAVEEYNDAVDQAINDTRNPVEPLEAMILYLPLLEQGIVPQDAFSELKPERVFSFEIGYKSRIKNMLYYDIVYYRSTYHDFIGFVRVNKPRTSPTTDLYTAFQQMNNSNMRELFYIHTNSASKVEIQGLSAGIKWLVPLGSVLSWNVTLSDIRTEHEDPIVPGFNTPLFKTNLAVSNRRLDQMENNPGMNRVGFYINWRFQSFVDWESPFASGRVDPYATLDWQISYNFQEPKAVIKVGANNFLNSRHTNTYGGAQVGIFYYVSFIIENLFQNNGKN